MRNISKCRMEYKEYSETQVNLLHKDQNIFDGLFCPCIIYIPQNVLHLVCDFLSVLEEEETSMLGSVTIAQGQGTFYTRRFYHSRGKLFLLFAWGVLNYMFWCNCVVNVHLTIYIVFYLYNFMIIIYDIFESILPVCCCEVLEMWLLYVPCLLLFMCGAHIFLNPFAAVGWWSSTAR